jgi:hypothetical protein
VAAVSEHLVSIEFDAPSGDTLRFDWDTTKLDRFDASAETPPWRLSGDLDWDEVEAIRVVTGALEDGGIAIAAIRPAGAAGHGEEAITGLLLGDDGPEGLDEVLLSTEHDADDLVTRVGLELYRTERGIPLRIAGDATATNSHVDGGVHHVTAALELRAPGATGSGRIDILRAG